MKQALIALAILLMSATAQAGLFDDYEDARDGREIVVDERRGEIYETYPQGLGRDPTRDSYTIKEDGEDTVIQKNYRGTSIPDFTGRKIRIERDGD